MRGDYFGKTEQIHKGENIMIIMDIKIHNLYAFKNFHMNMSYPKKIVDSTIEGEYLEERPNFRYKKVNIIMGGNATGKTSLGKVLMHFANYFNDREYQRFVDVINDRNQNAFLGVDFVTDENILYRFNMSIPPAIEGQYAKESFDIKIYSTEIGKRDNYEICSKRLDSFECEEIEYDKYENINTSGWHFSYPEGVEKEKSYFHIENNKEYLHILEQILKTLDPAIEEVIRLEVLDNTYAVKLKNQSVIIKNGKILGDEILSSGTKAGLDISYIIASIICNLHLLYYCDELFSYVNSDIEKACLSIIIDKLDQRKQLFFTTHNTDILDMQLPKHSFTFLKKDIMDEEMPIKCVNAGDFLKRNTDSLKHAVENDLFCIAPELDKLYAIAEI